MQFRELADAIQGVVQELEELPRRLHVRTVESGYTPPLPAPLHLPDVDTDSETLMANLEGQAATKAAVGKQEARLQRKGSKGLINPESFFARGQAKAQAGAKPDGGVKGPRMPAFRLWGPWLFNPPGS